MKKLITTSLALIFAFSLVWAQNKETRNVDTLTKISFGTPGRKSICKQGPVQKVKLQGDKDVLAKIRNGSKWWAPEHRSQRMRELGECGIWIQ
ncbi:MAG: hypothetical protein U5K54_20750 [Cytophagales bacterium]|nr:hypothetical protein [Cytophagales bacterium]